MMLIFIMVFLYVIMYGVGVCVICKIVCYLLENIDLCILCNWVFCILFIVFLGRFLVIIQCCGCLNCVRLLVKVQLMLLVFSWVLFLGMMIVMGVLFKLVCGVEIIVFFRMLGWVLISFLIFCGQMLKLFEIIRFLLCLMMVIYLFVDLEVKLFVMKKLFG